MNLAVSIKYSQQSGAIPFCLRRSLSATRIRMVLKFRRRCHLLVDSILRVLVATFR